MIYMIHFNGEDKPSISARCPDRKAANYLKEQLPSLDFIEVGFFTYWLLKHNFYKLAMMPFWD